MFLAVVRSILTFRSAETREGINGRKWWLLVEHTRAIYIQASTQVCSYCVGGRQAVLSILLVPGHLVILENKRVDEEMKYQGAFLQSVLCQ